MQMAGMENVRYHWAPSGAEFPGSATDADRRDLYGLLLCHLLAVL